MECLANLKSLPIYISYSYGMRRNKAYSGINSDIENIIPNLALPSCIATESN